MFINSLVVSSVILALTSQVFGHATINPPLGVTGTAVRADALRPSTAQPCGAVSGTISSLLATSSSVAASGNSFTATITNYNGGQDGSTQVTAQVDPTGEGKTFTAATVTKNGVLAPPAAGSAQITVALPAGTTCTGGTNKDTCLVAFKTAGGFGNCIAVTQGNAAVAASGSGAVVASTAAKAATSKAAAAATKAAAVDTTSAAAAAATKAASTAGSGACAAVAAAKDEKKKKAKAAAAATAMTAATANAVKMDHKPRSAHGTRAARYLRALERALEELELEDDDDSE